MPYGPLLTRQFGPNPKGSKLTIQEMDDNLLYLSESIALGSSLFRKDANNNILIDGFSLQSNTNGTFNVALGSNALLANTEGNSNIALGRSALVANTLGLSNIALGESSLASNETGSNNIALGESSLSSNTDGNYNIVLGSEALSTNTVGSYNIALGSNVQSGDFSGSIILGTDAVATADGQLAIGSPSFPIGPVVSEVSASSTHTLSINLNGTTYRLLMVQ